METIKKNQTANVGKYSYQYVDIAQIHEYLESINSKYIQTIKTIDGNDYVMTKRCFDNKWEDEWLQGCRVVDATLIGVKNPAQEQGSALTYARRYSLLMAYGLATEDDDATSLSKQIEVTEEYAKNYTFSFGKYKDKKLTEVIEEDEGYIDWLLKNEGTSQDIIKSIEILTGMTPPTTDDEDIELSKEMLELVNETGADIDSIYKYFKKTSKDTLTKEEKIKAIEILNKKKEK